MPLQHRSCHSLQTERTVTMKKTANKTVKKAVKKASKAARPASMNKTELIGNTKPPRPAPAPKFKPGKLL
jgi:hypothetical protein